MKFSPILQSFVNKARLPVMMRGLLQRELVLQPFYRVLGSNVDGSGLGLSIVSEVAQQYRAQVELADAHLGQEARRGLRVTVRFPARLQD